MSFLLVSYNLLLSNILQLVRIRERAVHPAQDLTIECIKRGQTERGKRLPYYIVLAKR